MPYLHFLPTNENYPTSSYTLQHFRTPDARFSHVHVDIVGPLSDFSGYKYLLTDVDRFTRCPEAIPMKDITAQSCADSFLLHWVARFGFPTIITTDREALFTSLLWTEMCQFLGSKLCHTTAFHPAANGVNERFNRSFKLHRNVNLLPIFGIKT